MKFFLFLVTMSFFGIAHATCQVQQALDANGQPTTVDVCDNGMAFGADGSTYIRSGGGSSYGSTSGVGGVTAFPAPSQQATATQSQAVTVGLDDTSSNDGSANDNLGAPARHVPDSQIPPLPECKANQQSNGHWVVSCPSGGASQQVQGSSSSQGDPANACSASQLANGQWMISCK